MALDRIQWEDKIGERMSNVMEGQEGTIQQWMNIWMDGFHVGIIWYGIVNSEKRSKMRCEHILHSLLYNTILYSSDRKESSYALFAFFLPMKVYKYKNRKERTDSESISLSTSDREKYNLQGKVCGIGSMCIVNDEKSVLSRY